MRVAITFRDSSEHERCGDEHCYPSFRRREAKSLAHFVEFDTPALANHVYLCGVSLLLLVCWRIVRLREVRRFARRFLRLSPLDQNRMVMFSDVGIVEARFDSADIRSP